MASRQCISLGVLLAGHIMEGKMIVCEFREPTSLLAIKFLRLFEISKVLMISPNLEGVCCAHEVMMPFGKGDHDRKHPSIIDLIVALGGSKGFGEVSDWFPYIMLLLRQHCTDCKLGCVSLYAEGIVIGRDGQDWSGSYKVLDPFKRFLLLGPPDPRVISSEAGERVSNSGITLNKSMVEMAKSQKQLNLSFIRRCPPVRYASNLDWVHTDLSMSDNDAEVLGLLLIKGALVEIEIQLVVAEDLHYPMDLRMMFAKSFREDEDIINVHYDLSIVDFDLENFIHHGLEGGG